MADFQLTDEYGFLGGVGGSCVFCNASKRTTDRPERIVTTSMVTDMEDAPPGVWPEKYLEMCETCITELGHLVGMVSEREADTQEQTIIAQQGEIDRLEDEIDRLNVLLRAYKTIEEK